MADAPRHRPLLALLIRLCAAAALATLGALVKLASDRGIHLLEIAFWRQAGTVPALLGCSAGWRRGAAGSACSPQGARSGTSSGRYTAWSG